ncbi:hypothetical protein EDD86DRAFT_12915 [Gorgonomyces haynaldii]|nr:hypothetical protein EDD86DRAFT_12915 [Gorgonomyces haynaldii]
MIVHLASCHIRPIRHYSVPRVSHLWVKHTGNPIMVPVTGCPNVSEFLERAKHKLSKKLANYDVDELFLLKSPGQLPLKPSLSLEELCQSIANSDENPLLLTVKKTPPPTKTILVRDVDEDGDYEDKFTTFIVQTDADVKELYQCFGQSGGLQRVSDLNLPVITKWADLEDGARYQAHLPRKYSLLKAQRWQENEARAMEDEVRLAAKDFLEEALGVRLLELPRIIKDVGKEDLQEWDGVLYAEDSSTIYLIEAKHLVTQKHLDKLAEKIKAFPDLMEKTVQREYQSDFKNILGLACSTYFEESLRERRVISDSWSAIRLASGTW